MTAFNRSLCPLSGVRLAGARGESRPGAVTQEEATRGRNVGDSGGGRRRMVRDFLSWIRKLGLGSLRKKPTVT